MGSGQKNASWLKEIKFKLENVKPGKIANCRQPNDGGFQYLCTESQINIEVYIRLRLGARTGSSYHENWQKIA